MSDQEQEVGGQQGTEEAQHVGHMFEACRMQYHDDASRRDGHPTDGTALAATMWPTSRRVVLIAGC